jgi:hypothetical protein
MSKTAKVHQVTDRKDEVSPYEFEVTLKALKERVQGWIATYGEDAYIDYSHNGYDQWSDSPCFEIRVDRDETTEETARRLETEEELSSQRAAFERAEYERLAKKYEGKK